MADPGELEHEAKQREADRVALERDRASFHNAGTIADAYVHATNADGETVVFVPGELLPDWVAREVAEGRAPLDEVARVRTLQRKQPRSRK